MGYILPSILGMLPAFLRTFREVVCRLPCRVDQNFINLAVAVAVNQSGIAQKVVDNDWFINAS